MADLDTYTFIPLILDEKAATISAPKESWSVKGLQDELPQLTSLATAMGGGLPPPPVPVNPARSAAITKLKENANEAYRLKNFPRALEVYTVGIKAAKERPLWEPAGLVKDELAGLYANRAQCHMAMGAWPEGLIDAKLSTTCKSGGNAKAWWRGGKCYMEMGRYEEARDWVVKGLEVEGNEEDLVKLLKDIEDKPSMKARLY